MRTSRFAGAGAAYRDNVELLLQEMEGAEDRQAQFRTAVALVMPDGAEMVVDGWLDGVIADSPRGDGVRL